MSDDRIQYLTPAGYEKIKKEYQELKDSKIPEIANKIDEAKQQGDLSENAEYHQAKEEMAWAQGRLIDLGYILNNAQVFETSSNGKKSLVAVGSRVKCKNKNKQIKEYTIVGPQEANPIGGKISNESPLGESFLGHKVGDIIKVKTPLGEQIYEILEIN